MMNSVKCDCLLLLSGGIDSTTVLAKLVAAGRRPLCLIFDYGQTLEREIPTARANAMLWGCESLVLRSRLPDLFPNHPLLNRAYCPNTGQPPVGRTLREIAAGGTPATYVPFRNGIFLAYAVALGESHGLTDLYAGANGLNSGNYWDDTEVFASAFEAAADAGTDPKYKPRVRFPLARLTKSMAVREGLKLGVDYGRTWSCYQNGRTHCGACDSCVQRAPAMAEHGLDLDGRPMRTESERS